MLVSHVPLRLPPAAAGALRWRALARLVLAALGAFVVLAATAWVRPLMLPDEGRYVGVAWEMLRSGDWLTPTLNGLPFFHKPPLFYWITAGAVGLFGPGDLAARAAPLFGAWLAAMALHGFLLRWAGSRVAWLALVALLAQPLFLLGGQFANLDMLVAGCISATVLALADAALAFEAGLPHRRARLAAYAFAALGLLAKGLIGAVIPVLVIGTWLLLRGRWRSLLALWSWAGLVLFALIAAPWFVAMQLRFPDFLDYFFVVQHFKRFAASGFNNVQPFWFYPAALALLSLPWLPWFAARPGAAQRSPARLLMTVWALVVVLFFSWPQSKLIGYVLPAVPPLAALLAEGFVVFAARSAHARRWWALSTGTALAACGVALAALLLHPQHSTREIAATLAQHRAAHEPVLMLGNHYYDVPWYAGLHAPVIVVDDWAARGPGEHDDWHKELADAAAFDPLPASQRLLSAAQASAVLCSVPMAWVVGPDAAAGQPLLARAELMRSVRGTNLWRVPGRRADDARCAEAPQGSLADR
jgi:4-amino-4-deoxy-L-arabinose transferase-like glycosyltransferase